MTGLIPSLLRALIDPGLERPQHMSVPLAALVHQLRSLSLLLARLHVAQVFFLSGLSKLRDWSSTLALFEDEYHVPLLPSEIAAYVGTGGELLLPVFLALGLAGRFAALGLSVMNVVAVVSLAEIAPAALAGHQLWGAMLAVIALWGSGQWSLDAWLARRHP